MENFSELVKASRSFRRFDETQPVSQAQLYELASLLRSVPCGTNKQALKAITVTGQTLREKIFPLLGWAALLGDWNGPREGQRPTGYIILVCDTGISKPEARRVDAGIAAQTMALAATDAGLGACIMGSFPHAHLKAALRLDLHLEPMLLLAIGKPAETVKLVDIGSDGNTNYYRDKASTHLVPKRPLSELIIEM